MAIVKKAAPASKAPGTALRKWDEELAKYASAKKEEEASVALGKFVSLKSGVLSFNGNAVAGNKMNIVVLDSVLENHYYTEAYDSDNPASPVCFAFGRADGEMAPHEKSSEPQHDTCKGCPQNEFGSAEKGRGKACKNVRRLSLIPEDAIESPEGVAEAEVAFLKLSVLNVKGWAGYVQQLESTLRRPPFAVVTEISVVPDPKSQFKVNFKYVESVPDAMIEALIAKVEGGKDGIMFPYTAMEAKPAPPAKPNKFTKGARR